jgi:hypothetical protein
MKLKRYNKLSEEEKLYALDILTEELDDLREQAESDTIQINEVETPYCYLIIDDIRNKYIAQCLEEGYKLEFKWYKRNSNYIWWSFGENNVDIKYIRIKE